jgi:hypothetical protein
MDWKTLEPIFITSIIGLVGWTLIEISNLRVSSGKIQTELAYVKDSIKDIKADINTIKLETANLDNKKLNVPVEFKLKPQFITNTNEE